MQQTGVKIIKIACGILLLLSAPIISAQQAGTKETTRYQSDNYARKSVYQDSMKHYGAFYTYLWGKHYYPLYYKPVTVRATHLSELHNGLSIKYQLPKFHAVILNDKKDNLYYLKPLGGSTIFMESKFFRSTYQPEDYKNTYLGNFIGNAYTVAHPYAFMAAEQMANSLRLISPTPSIAFIADCEACDTIADGSSLQNKLVSVSKLPDLETDRYVTSANQLLDKLHSGNNNRIDRTRYIRTRLFDMLIGDWNKIPESWNWAVNELAGDTVYSPIVVDHNHAFSKVDGVFFKLLINVLGLGFVEDYGDHIKNIKKFNQLGYPLDIALTQGWSEKMWTEQANYIQANLTDNAIDMAFKRLPAEIQNDAETARIKANLKNRRDNLHQIAVKYYKELQKTPVLTGTDNDDRFVIDEDESHNLHIKRYDTSSGKLVFDRKYSSKQTKEIWLYSLRGNDTILIDKRYNSIPLLLIGGQGVNEYNVVSGHKVSVYENKCEKERLDTLPEVKKIFPDGADKALAYNYEKLRYTQWGVTPIGIYDSDLGLNIGTSVTYTVYGFGRSPYSRRHQFSYDYVNGFTYQGIFPDYNCNHSFHLSAYIGSSVYFSNFFGFGNETPGYKDEENLYNRVNLKKYALSPALYFNLGKFGEVNFTSAFQIFKVNNPEGRNRFINEVYPDNSSIFKEKYYVDISANYKLEKKTKYFISKYNIGASAGWTTNMGDPGKNFPYLAAKVGANIKITDRLTFAWLMKGRKLLTDKYEFYQSASTELRGFRDNRFIGKSSFYQYSDIRLDMGKLNNPFTPLLYGVFVGVDYGRVWYPFEDSHEWHSSYGGGFWLTVFRNFTGKFSYFASKDTGRFTFTLGMGF